MVKQTAQEPRAQYLQAHYRQYLVSAKKFATEKESQPKILQMRVFARNEVSAKTKFWYNMRKLNKIKRAQGQVLSVNEIFEKNCQTVRTYGFFIKYQSRTARHNMYREYRDVSINGAYSQMLSDMTGNHRANPETIQVIRTTVTNKASDLKTSGKNVVFRNSQVKFPVIKTLPRSKQQKIQKSIQSRKTKFILMLILQFWVLQYYISVYLFFQYYVLLRQVFNSFPSLFISQLFFRFITLFNQFLNMSYQFIFLTQHVFQFRNILSTVFDQQIVEFLQIFIIFIARQVWNILLNLLQIFFQLLNSLF